MADVNKIPTLVIADSTDEAPMMLGLPRLFFEGVEVPWLITVGDWHVNFSDNGLTTLTLEIPVRLRVVPREVS